MTLSRRRLLAAVPAASALAALGAPPAAQASVDGRTKVLRYSFPTAETGFDPAQVSDIYSRTVTAHIFDSAYAYDYLARPVVVVPLVADGMPKVSDDFRTWTVRIRPGIYFADDPAFKGTRRELVAQDFVYSFKRFFDPKNKSPVVSGFEEYGILGLNELRAESLKNKSAFDYDRPIAGLRALDRYTYQFQLVEPAPHFLEVLAGPDLVGAVAREVVEAYGDKIMEHPVGTGPFRLAQWKRSSKIVLERNPGYRQDVFSAQPGDSPEAQAVAAKLKGQRLPLLDRVEISIIEESQPRWLSFLNGENDFLERLPNDFVNIAAPGGALAPGLARQGVRMQRTLLADVTYTVFNMKHPVVGGYTADKVALRRAISLAMDMDQEIRLTRRGQAIKGQAPLNPHTYGFDPKLKTEMSDYDLPRARALLDLYGYVDRNGDGWREQPDGTPLVLEISTSPDQASRQLDELRRKWMDALGLKAEFKVAKWPEHLKAARGGKFMMWGLGSSAASYDSRPALQRGAGSAAGGQNLSFFDHPEFNRVYDRLRVTPNGPERLALIERANRIWIAYMPYKVHVHRIGTDLWHPWVSGWFRQPFQLRFLDMMDVDARAQAQAVGV